MKRPRVTVNCIASRYAGPGERIIEFSFPDGTGGLISFMNSNNGSGHKVELYRMDPVIVVMSPFESLPGLGRNDRSIAT